MTHRASLHTDVRPGGHVGCELYDCVAACECVLMTDIQALFDPDPANAPTDLRPTALTVQLTNVINSRRAAPPRRHLIIKKRQETYSFFILLLSHPASPPSPVPLISPAFSSGASVRCSERRCACVGERGERCTVLRTGSAGHHRITALVSRVVVEGGDWTRTRSEDQDQEKHRGSLQPALQKNMSEFFLLAFLALFSGLFPCTEPSTVSDEEKEVRVSSPKWQRWWPEDQSEGCRSLAGDSLSQLPPGTSQGLSTPSCSLGPENQNRGGIHPSPNKLHSADKPKASW
ncbi:hypothetical protein PAMA_003455 [Pampus argenteus]